MQTRDMTAVVTRTDLWRVDPRLIEIQSGWNPRTTFELEDLRDSIREHGVLSPIRVRKSGDTLILVDGERRVRAVLDLINAGVDIKSIPALIESSQNEADLLVMALTTNLGEPLNPLDEARAFQRLVGYGFSQLDIARKVGRSPAYVHTRLTLLQGTHALQADIASNTVTITEAKDIIKESAKTGVSQEAVKTERQARKAQEKTRIPQEPIEIPTSAPKPDVHSVFREHLAEYLMGASIEDLAVALFEMTTEEEIVMLCLHLENKNLASRVTG